MTAGVHDAWSTGLERNVCDLLDRQRVHVGAKADAAVVASLAPQHADDAGLADLPVDLDAPVREMPGHDAGRALLLETKLRMRMKIPPQRDKIVRVAGDAIENAHWLQFPCCAMRR